LLATWALAGAAWAQAASADIELVHASFSEGSVPGVDTPDIGRPGTVRLGSLLVYERDPLIQYRFDEEVGAVVANRTSVAFGASWDVSRIVSARIVLPVDAQWGSEVPSLAADGVGLSDAALGVRVVPLAGRRARMGIRGDVVLPTGTRLAWMGEAEPRAGAALLGELDFGAWDALAELGALGRSNVDTGQDFTLGTELDASLAVRYAAWPDHVAVWAGALARDGFENFLQGGAENPNELLTGAQVRLMPDALLDLGGGKGLAQGYGTSEIRLFAGLTLRRVRKVEAGSANDVVVAKVPVSDVQIQALPEEETEEPWAEHELARLKETEIVIREPIQFEFGTSRILPASLPTLSYVAGLLNGHGEIAHLLIEGHASEEGSFAYNFELSNRRAQAIFEELIGAGVHPDRLSYRGMGEVAPASAGTNEAALATNRRVQFKVVRQLDPTGERRAYGTEVAIPWSGEKKEVPEPLWPEAVKEPPKPEPEKVDPNAFKGDEEE
jgi:outer membrane protein OmpA-like peptidoglycan-associated protein